MQCSDAMHAVSECVSGSRMLTLTHTHTLTLAQSRRSFTHWPLDTMTSMTSMTSCWLTYFDLFVCVAALRTTLLRCVALCCVVPCRAVPCRAVLGWGVLYDSQSESVVCSAPLWCVTSLFCDAKCRCNECVGLSTQSSWRAAQCTVDRFCNDLNRGFG